MIEDKYIKECYESNDVKALRDIFVHAPDRDPSFEMFRNDYNECRDKLFEPHKELTPLADNSNGKWKNKDYFATLHLDLMRNFSQKRFEHLLEVAKVYYGVAEKMTKSSTQIATHAPKLTAPMPKPTAAVHQETQPRQTQNFQKPPLTSETLSSPSTISSPGQMSSVQQTSPALNSSRSSQYRTMPPKGMSAEEKNRAAAEQSKKTAITVFVVVGSIAVVVLILLLILL